MKKRSSTWSLIAVFGLFLPIMLLWAGVFRGDTMPFSEIRWRNGHPELKQEGKWMRLISVSGIPADSLVERAVQIWGPGYQRHFAMQFPAFLEEMGGQIGLWVDMELTDGDRLEETRAFSTRQRRANFWENMAMEAKSVVQSSQKSELRRIDPKGDTPAAEWLSETEASEDLALLRVLLDDCYAFREHLPPLQDRLAKLANSFQGGISRRDFALQIQHALAALDDIHAKVSFSHSKVRLPGKDLPFDLLRLDGHTICLEPGGKALLDPDFPLLSAIQGIPLDDLWEAANLLGGDPTNWMQRIDLVLRLRGMVAEGKLEVKLRSLGGQEKVLSLSLGYQPANSAAPFRVESHVLPGGIGHLRLRNGLYADDGYQREIVQAMYGLKDSQGLILDLRGNPGGKRRAIPLLLHYFLPPETHPMIVNVGAYRMDQARRPSAIASVLRGRDLYPKNWSGWSPAQRRAFTGWPGPEITYSGLDDSLYSAPHFMLTSEEMPTGAYFYHHPVIVLVDKGTASATELLLVHLKGQPNVTVMGSRSTGGSGYPLLFFLPNSNLQFYLSTMRSYSPDLQAIAQTEPDIVYAPKLEDVLESIVREEDPLLEMARRKLAESGPVVEAELEH